MKQATGRVKCTVRTEMEFDEDPTITEPTLQLEFGALEESAFAGWDFSMKFQVIDRSVFKFFRPGKVYSVTFKEAGS